MHTVYSNQSINQLRRTKNETGLTRILDDTSSRLFVTIAIILLPLRSCGGGRGCDDDYRERERERERERDQCICVRWKIPRVKTRRDKEIESQ
jgi:hypothetical protein